jgi:four helix bundle protein
MVRTNGLQSYEDLDIYRMALKLAVEVHQVSLEELPRFEMFEEGSQIRRSSKSIGSNIVEGFGRKKNKGEYVQFLTYALASCDETKYHIEVLYRTDSLGEEKHKYFAKQYGELGRKIYSFRKAVLDG